MGKKKNGRAKQKQKAQSVTSTSTPKRNNTRGMGFSYDDDDDEVPQVMYRGFAGMTSRAFTSRDPSIKLRHQTIAFVSAGSTAPLEDEPINDELIAAIQLNDSQEDDDTAEEAAAREEPVNVTNETRPAQDFVVEEPNTTVIMEVDTIDTAEQRVSGSPHIEADADGDLASTSPAPEPESLQFIVDTEGDASLAQATNVNATLPAYRSKSPSPSDSEEDVIVFRGRNQARVIDDPPKQAASTAPNVNYPLIDNLTPDNGEQESASQEWTPAPEGAWWRKQKGDETVDTVRAEWKAALKQKKQLKEQRATSTHLEEKSPTAKLSRRGKRGRKRGNRLLRELQLDGSDPEDAAELDYIENVKAQMSAEQMEPGDLEVVTLEDKTTAVDDELNWEDIEMTADDSDESEEIIGQDLSDVLNDEDDDDDDFDTTDSDASDLEEALDHAERELLQAEENLRQDRFGGMTDDHIARLWAKQIELGIDADELVIDDGGPLPSDNFDAGDLEAARAGLAELTTISKAKGKRAGRRRGGGRDMSFPDASALADSLDQYGNDGFDIMDYDRPSLRNTKKGRKGKMPPELDALSDEELRETVFDSWEKDRAKKRVKKAEREEIRAQGLLGAAGRSGKADLGQKYQQGMTMAQVYAELEVFLLDDDMNSRAFPPMDKTDRKALHQVANTLNLKSKSVGSGSTRFPVLYKTARTADFDDVSFNRVVKAASRGFLKNQGWATKGKKGGKAPKRGGNGDAGTAAVTPRHGEVVGAGAKELGKENFGHKLMEKMGWSKGMALGKDGEGMLVPVEQTMRIGKAGLG